MRPTSMSTRGGRVSRIADFTGRRQQRERDLRRPRVRPSDSQRLPRRLENVTLAERGADGIHSGRDSGAGLNARAHPARVKSSRCTVSRADPRAPLRESRTEARLGPGRGDEERTGCADGRRCARFGRARSSKCRAGATVHCTWRAREAAAARVRSGGGGRAEERVARRAALLPPTRKQLRDLRGVVFEQQHPPEHQRPNAAPPSASDGPARLAGLVVDPLPRPLATRPSPSSSPCLEGLDPLRVQLELVCRALEQPRRLAARQAAAHRDLDLDLAPLPISLPQGCAPCQA